MDGWKFMSAPPAGNHFLEACWQDVRFGLRTCANPISTRSRRTASRKNHAPYLAFQESPAPSEKHDSDAPAPAVLGFDRAPVKIKRRWFYPSFAISSRTWKSYLLSRVWPPI